MRMLWLLILLPISAFSLFPQIKVSYFKPTLPTNKDFLKISTAEYQIEALYHIKNGLNVFAHGGYINSLKKNSIRLYPMTVGLKYVKPVARLVSLYGYAGPRLFYYQQSGVNGFNRSKINGAVGVGMLTFMSKHWCLDSFGEWSRKTVVAGSLFGGWSVGSGFAYIF